MQRKYVYSDPHLGHRNIINFERVEFKTIDEHDNHLIKMYNMVVKPNDICYWLGDVGKLHRVHEFNGYKILIMGNHDRYKKQQYFDAGFDEVYSFPQFVHRSIILSHEPIPVSEHFINIHGHLHGADLDSPRHICVSAMNINYMPRLITSYDHLLEGLPKIRERFLSEWYADLYVFSDVNRDDVVVDEKGKIKLQESIEKRK